MADISVTAASVAKGSNAVVNNDFLAGASIAAGKVVYVDASNTWQLAQADGTALEAGWNAGSTGPGTFGIALHTSVSGQPLAVQTDGLITMGATLVAGTVYAISATAGGVAPLADILAAATSKTTYLGYATTTGILNLNHKKATLVTIA